MKKIKNSINKIKSNKAVKNIAVFAATFAVAVTMFAVPAYADEVTTPLTNAVNLMFTIFRIVGVGVTGFSIFELATAIKSHDGSQRNMAFLGIASGLLITFIKEVLTLIGVSF